MAQMPKFLEDYVTVDELISKMNKEYPNCRLVSEMMGYGDDWVIFKSSFFENKDDLEPKATAYAKQTNKDHNSWFEMANTKANGRCLRIVFSETTLAEEMIGIVPSKDDVDTIPVNDNKSSDKPLNQGVKYKYEGYTSNKEQNIDKLQNKINLLEKDGLVEDVSMKLQAVMDNIKDFALDLTNGDLEKARQLFAQALGEMGMNKKEVNISNLQTIKNKMQDIITFSKTETDGGE